MWTPFQQWLVWAGKCFLIMTFWTWSQLIRIFNDRSPVSPVSDRILLYSASDLAKQIRTRKIRSTEVLQAYIKRIKEVNPVINAVVQSRFDEALQEAVVVDETLARGGKSEEELARDTPLLGVPITIKESIAVSGMSNNAGVPGQSRVAQKDAPAVAALRTAGAIPLLVSNTPELCQSWETYNPVTGRTNNPYDPRRTPGGSSGGEAALISSAASVIGLGSDIGGSGRLPANFCGIFGHKPSSEYIDVAGHMPFSEDPLWPKVFVFAPFCRYAEDLTLVLKASASDKDRLRELRLDEPVDLKKMRFFYLNDDGCIFTTNVQRDIKTALNKTISHIEKTYDVSVEKCDLKLFRHVAQMSFYLLRIKACHNVFQKTPENLTEWKSVAWQTIKWMIGLSPHALHAILYGSFKRFADGLSKQSVQDLDNCRETFKNQLDELLGDNGVLLLPTYPKSAHYHWQVYYLSMNSGYMAFCNMLDMPATACPIMRNSAGIPVGIQIVAKRGQDRLTLAVARELEKAFGGWVPPTGADMTSVHTSPPSGSV